MAAKESNANANPVWPLIGLTLCWKCWKYQDQGRSHNNIVHVRDGISSIFCFTLRKFFFLKKKKTLTLKHLHFLMNEKLVDLIPIKRSHTCTQTFNHTYTPIFNVRWHSVYIQSTPEAHTLCTHESFWVKFYLGRRSVILIMSDLTCVKYSSPDGHPTGFIGRPWEAKNITHTNIIYISISHPLLVDWI